MTPESLALTPSPGQEQTLLLGIAGCFILANLLTWMAFRLDSRRAEQGGPRVPAVTLLLLALLGGAPAALLSDLVYRREPGRGFGLTLKAIFAVQVLTTGAVFVPQDRVADRITALKASTLAVAGADADNGPVEKALPHRFGPGSDQPSKTGLGG